MSIRLKAAKQKLGPNEQLWLFVKQVDELLDEDLVKLNPWFISLRGDPNSNVIPSKPQLVSFLALFRQFFLLSSEQIAMQKVRTAFFQVVADQDLQKLANQIAKVSPFEPGIEVQMSGKKFDPKEWLEGWVSKHFHSDDMPEHLEGLDGFELQIALFPLSLTFVRGIKILCAMRGVILEAHRRGLIPAANAIARP